MLQTPAGGRASSAPGARKEALKEPLFNRLMDKALPRLRRWLPYNRFGDRIYHRALFLRKHGRLPRNELMWNDVWYRVKTSDEILDPLRVFVSDKEHVKYYIKAIV